MSRGNSDEQASYLQTITIQGADGPPAVYAQRPDLLWVRRSVFGERDGLTTADVLFEIAAGFTEARG